GIQALLAGRDRGDADIGERLLDPRRLVMGAYQHGDVARLHRPALDGGGARTAFGQHRVDRRDAGHRAERARIFRPPRLHLALEVGPWFRRAPDRQRRGRRARALEIVVLVRTAGFDRTEADARIDEGVLA